MKVVSIGKNTRGFSTLEILIAFAVISLAITAVIGSVFSGQSLAIDTQTNIEAVSKAETQLETARALSRQNFALVQTIAPSVDGIYTKRVDVTTISSLIKKVESTVSWSAGGRTLSVNFSTLLSDWQNGVKCSPTLTGDWTAPQVYGYLDFPSSAGATSVFVLGGKAYITSDPSSPGTDDFYVADVTGVGPGVGTLPKLGSFSTSYGLTDLYAKGSYAFVMANSASFQVLVIDISDPAALSPSKIKAKVDLTASGDAAVGNAIAYANNKLYVGLTIASKGAEFFIIDISDPLAPQIQGSYEVGNSINHIVIKNKVAYLTTASNNQIVALNVADPLNPTLADKFVSATLTGQGLAMNNTSSLYFGRIGGAGNPKLLAFNSGNLSAPIWTMNMSSQSGVYTLVLRQNLLFMTTADPNDGLQIWDVSGGFPVRYDTSPLNIQQTATAGTDCAGNLLYVAQRSNRAMQVIGPWVPNDYTLSTGGPISLVQGDSGNTPVNATLVSGVAQNITFGVSGLPAGATASFSSKSCTVTCSTALTITTTLSTPPGTYPITVTGTGGKSTTFNLVVSLQVFDYTLSTPGNVSLVRAGASKPTSFTATLTTGTTRSVSFSNSALPSGVSISYSAPSCNPTCNITLTLSASAGATTGTTPVTITGSSPTHTTSFTLTVTAPAFAYTLSTSGNLSIDPGKSATHVVTVTMTPGAVAQSVTVVPVVSDLPAGVSISPASAACTPSSGSCTVQFDYTAAPGAKKSPNNTIHINGSAPVDSTTFKLTVN